MGIVVYLVVEIIIKINHDTLFHFEVNEECEQNI